jgi:hypothetical protein
MKKLSFILTAVPTMIQCSFTLAQGLETKIDSLRELITKPFGYRREITLQKALSLVEEYNDKENVDITQYFLFGVKFILWGPQKEPRWLFRWVNEYGTNRDYMETSITMKGDVEPPNYGTGKTVELPLDTISGKYRPRITLQEALRRVERYVEIKNIDITRYHLHYAGLILFASRELRWWFWWSHEDGAMGNYVQLTVSMDGKVSRIPSL